MTNVSVPLQLIKTAGRLLSAQKAESSAALEKVAALELDSRAATAVLELIQAGHLDPLCGMAKLAEFRDNPENILLTKHAAQLGCAVDTQLGTTTEFSSDLVAGDTPEERFASRLSDFNQPI